MDGVDDTPPATAVEPLMGDGNMPEHLDRINWGVTLLTGLWLLLHGLWLWWIIDVAVLYGWLVVLYAVRTQAGNPSTLDAPAFLVAGIAVTVIRWALWLWFGRHANAGVWRRERRRLDRGRPGRCVSNYVGAERLWTIAGVSLLVLGSVVGVANVVMNPARVVGGVAGEVAASVISATFLVAAWVWDRRLVERARPHA